MVFNSAAPPTPADSSVRLVFDASDCDSLTLKVVLRGPWEQPDPLTGEGIRAVAFNLLFNESTLEWAGWEAQEIIDPPQPTCSQWLTICGGGAGSLTCGHSSVGVDCHHPNYAGDKVLAIYEFNAVNEQECTNIVWTDSSVRDEDVREIPGVTFYDGNICS